MLHQIKLPSYDNALQEFLNFQLQLITFACTPARSYPLTKDAVQREFTGEVGKWLYNKLWPKGKSETDFHRHLKHLIDHVACHQSQTIGTDIIDAYKHDIDFHEHFDDTTFWFHYHKLDLKTQEIVKTLMNYFYQLLYKGFLVSSEKYQKFDLHAMVTAFRDENKKILAVCPACDGQAPSWTRVRDAAQVDHFFPKSLYPFLSIHPYNLAPICIQCNTVFKRDTDPIQQGLLVDTFHPYGHPAITDIEVHIIDGYEVSLVDVVCREQKVQAVRLENLVRIFDLQILWEDCYFPIVKDDFVRHLRGIGRNRKGKSLPLSADIVREELEAVLQNYKEDVGMRQYYLLRSSYACYALTHDEEFKRLVFELMGGDEE